MNDAASLAEHVEILCTNYLRLTGHELIASGTAPVDTVRRLAAAPFAVVSHGIQDDPIFNYGNNIALELFEMTWYEFTLLPSRLSAEIINQFERARLLGQVSKQGHIDNYSGIRISKSSRRFMIKDATVWNLIGSDGKYYGQAALIRSWDKLP